MTEESGARWAELTTTERDLLERVSASELMNNLIRIASWTRLSGSAEEMAAAEFVRSKLLDYGLTAEVVTHEALISLPVSARLAVEEPEAGRRLGEPACIAHSFGASTPPGGVSGELVYVGLGRQQDYDDLDVRGRIVLVEGLASPETAKVAEEHGAAGHVHINDEHLHEMIVSPVWGSPEPADCDRLPRTPAVSILESTGAELKAMLRAGPVRVRLETRVETTWRQIPLVLGSVGGRGEPERYVLLSGHLDSWHKGAMDNGSANATMLEVARLLARDAHLLQRGLKVAFWSGHSHGRYAGSAHYADQNWLDLEKNCVAHVNVDSTGAHGASTLAEAGVMAEARDFAGGCVRAVVPGEVFVGSRLGRAGDQSFWGPGVPSLFMSLSQQPAAKGKTAESFQAIIGGAARLSGGLGWWWHTTEDTLDKIDEQNLVRDTRIYLLTVLRLCSSAVLPYDYRRVCAELRGAVRGYARQVSSRFDLGPVVRELDALEAALERVQLALARLTWQAERRTAAGQQGSGSPSGGLRGHAGQSLDRQCERANRLLMAIGRILIPLGYVAGSRYGQDPALPARVLPTLAGLEGLAALEAGSPQFLTASIHFQRRRTRALHALTAARSAAEEWLSEEQPHR